MTVGTYDWDESGENAVLFVDFGQKRVDERLWKVSNRDSQVC